MGWFKKLEKGIKHDFSGKAVVSDLKKVAVGALDVAAVGTKAALTYGFTAAGAVAGGLIDPAGGEVLGGIAGNFIGGFVGQELTNVENRGIVALGAKPPPAIIGDALDVAASFANPAGEASAAESIAADVGTEAEAAEEAAPELASAGDIAPRVSEPPEPAEPSADPLQGAYDILNQARADAKGVVEGVGMVPAEDNGGAVIQDLGSEDPGDLKDGYDAPNQPYNVEEPPDEASPSLSGAKRPADSAPEDAPPSKIPASDVKIYSKFLY